MSWVFASLHNAVGLASVTAAGTLDTAFGSGGYSSAAISLFEEFSAALAPGWEWNHKTGTGQALNGRIAGIKG